MENEFMKRGYLLPTGCKDLIDVIRREETPRETSDVSKLPWLAPDPLPWLKAKENLTALPAPHGEISVSAKTTVRELAELLGKKAYTIITDLMSIGVFAVAEQVLDFQTIEKVARKYGFKAKRAQ